MGFLALRKNLNFTDNENNYFTNKETKIFFSPLPSIKDTGYPTVWLDLHLCNDWYEKCGKDKKLNFVTRKIAGDEFYYVTIRPGESLRFRTAEKIGIKEDVVGLVVNSASRAIKGLSVAPGKIDPGFKPNQLTLVMTNLSKRSIDLKTGCNGDKILEKH